MIFDESGTKLKPCPKCGCDDELEIDSSFHAAMSWVNCNVCDHSFQSRCREENIGRHWNKHVIAADREKNRG